MRNLCFAVFAIGTCILASGCGGGSGSSGNSGGGGGTTTPPVTTSTISLSAATYTFTGNIVNNAETQTVVALTNNGSESVTLAPALTGDASFAIVSTGSCGTTLTAGQSCNEIVSYTPTVAGSQTSTLNFNPGNVPSGTTATVALTGQATSITLSATSYDFGDNIVNNVETQTVVTVTNAGPYSATLAPALTGNASFSVVNAGSCGTTLDAQQTCNEIVSYTPTTTGSSTATLALNPDSFTSSATMVALTGTAATYTPGSVGNTANNNPLVAAYTVNMPFPGTVAVAFGPDASYGLSTSSQSVAAARPVTILVAGMLQSKQYHMSATLTFSNGVTVSDPDQTFTTGSYSSGSIPTMTVTTNGTPQPGIEILNVCCYGMTTNTSPLRLLATDLKGEVVWGYSYPASDTVNPLTLGNSTSIYAPKLLPNNDILMVIGVDSAAPLDGTTPATTLIAGREIDLSGQTVHEVTLAQLNANLQTATCQECQGLVLQNMHHDITPLPDGNWLMVTNVLKSVTLTGSSTPTTLLGDVIMEVNPTTGTPLWAWNEFNHLDVNRHPMSLTDWTHTNAVIYSKDDGDFLVSMRHQNLVVKVDFNNGTGTGKIKWYLGREMPTDAADTAMDSAPFFTLQGATDPTDWFYAQHAPSFTTTNTSGVFGLTLMDNGNDRVFPTGVTCQKVSAGDPSCYYSTVPVMTLDETAMTATMDFHETFGMSIFNTFGGNAETLANGDVEYDLCGLSTQTSDLTLLGSSQIGEVPQTGGSDAQPVWQMNLPKTTAYRAFRTPSLYANVQWSGTSF